ncbi:cytochrome c oxidase assembly protein [Sinorhizobium medicae]|uniref:Cytochrome c oxidase assembly protein CtaG n=2 Tax=Sinorhizobium medicae TaxID=110321 RepID=COXZ_SINMW|nr:cytochrome c oxidase assembly protein [Sinorhizobium medicae]A6U6U8.1 RecName: Full=Cytochrome c oxidase assembly protein CtaG [Sinorhizobium medicae WSM419]ABR59378.1 cytochrome c oxidase assembly protein CtaG/Cox11 [Sinorhizobium medicae WSM419]MBO1939436.1 cytochrome c oxidase assembly protein [Sinorhizobium medicae]MBO1963336.1 cytochrome c oxidase assembly protein [Sinorhizobium medicae]MDX0404004.1 cytochrome c oxidase assembly protein [Sinorhizobium medicae]MDX0409864.1 cytochrome c
MADTGQSDRKERSNGVIVGTCLAFVVGMVGMAYAAVPLYDMFCRVTGYNGTTQRVEQESDLILDEKVKVTFDANVAAGLPWEFAPVQRDIDVRIGETVQITYRARNLASTPTTGQATFNVTPMAAGAYFNKVQCFCFTETTLQPGEEMEMPVVFFVDPEIVKTVETKGIKTLTLSYTFYPREPSKPVAQVKSRTENKL